MLQLILVGSLCRIHIYDATLHVSGFSGMTRTSVVVFLLLLVYSYRYENSPKSDTVG